MGLAGSLLGLVPALRSGLPVEVEPLEFAYQRGPRASAEVNVSDDSKLLEHGVLYPTGEDREVCVYFEIWSSPLAVVRLSIQVMPKFAGGPKTMTRRSWRAVYRLLDPRLIDWGHKMHADELQRFEQGVEQGKLSRPSE